MQGKGIEGETGEKAGAAVRNLGAGRSATCREQGGSLAGENRGQLERWRGVREWVGSSLYLWARCMCLDRFVG